MTKLLRIMDIYGNTKEYNAAALIRAACNDSDNFTGSFLNEIQKLDHIKDFDQIAEKCAPSLGGNWLDGTIVEAIPYAKL